MKLSIVLASTNNNPDYYMFIPKQILFWKKFDIKFIAIYIGDKLPEYLLAYIDNIIIWNNNLDIHTAYAG